MLHNHPILALPRTFPNMKLFSESPGTAGFVVLAILIFVILFSIVVAVIRYVHAKRMENSPRVLGDPKLLLNYTCDTLGLGFSERRLLKKLAARMNLSQPTSIILSPALLLNAANIWGKMCLFGTTKQWGISKLDNIAKEVYGKSLRELNAKR